jgi:malto-oligosyltrehalose synthase
MGLVPAIATYRLQLTPAFGFAHARHTLPYLTRLGVSHVYLSPIFEARTGSTHGYDQTDPTLVRAELGGEDEFRRLAAEIHARHMGMLVDIVPNHLAADYANRWWRQMLAEGANSAGAKFFDVDWRAGKGRVVLPLLGQPLSEAVQVGEIVVEYRDGLPVLRYAERMFPLRESGEDAPLNAGAATMELLERQHYELTFWREGLARINYRRFFDIADLVAVRVEDPAVFAQTHAGILRLAADGLIDGVRVDHIDGLLRPKEYLYRLRRRLDDVSPQKRIAILVEKILGLGEMLPEDWDVDGTTGYEYAGALAHLMAPAAGVVEIRQTLAKMTDMPADFHVTAQEGKRYAARHMLGAELERLTRLAVPILDAPDFGALRDALIEISAHLGVYRTYGDEHGLSPTDRQRIEQAAEAAQQSLPQRRGAIAAVAATLLSQDAACRQFLMKWQQFTGPLTAKGVEDTALYRDTLFLACNEVGSDPQPETRADEVLQTALALRERRPWSLNPGATHDTKRGEDARARLAILAMIPTRWLGLVKNWLQTPSAVPPAERLLIYQALWGLWPQAQHNAPDVAERLAQFLPKALREAKVQSTWYAPHAPAETAAIAFARTLLLAETGATFRRDLATLDHEMSPTIRGASVLSVLLRLLAPGVPDVYQGTEAGDWSLVDPDNRRPPHFAALARQLESAEAAWHAGGDIGKMGVYWRALRVRKWLLEGGGPLEMADLGVRDGEEGRMVAWRVGAGEREAEVGCWLAMPKSGKSLKDEWKPKGCKGLEQLRGVVWEEMNGTELPAGVVLSLLNSAQMHPI